MYGAMNGFLVHQIPTTGEWLRAVLARHFWHLDNDLRFWLSFPSTMHRPFVLKRALPNLYE